MRPQFLMTPEEYYNRPSRGYSSFVVALCIVFGGVILIIARVAGLVQTH
mgnify:CR=1 FL=1